MGYSCGFILLLSTAVVLVTGEPLSRAKREAANLEPGNWDSCKPGAPVPPTRVPTQARVAELRNLFGTNSIEAYIVPNEDAHQSEYPSNYDMRRGYISGFQGSAGTAVITTTRAALWTDGRYFLEAEDTLDCGWILMRQGETGVPSIIDWLKSELQSGVSVGASPFLISSSGWKSYTDGLQPAGIVMEEVQPELVDQIWNAQLRPPQPSTDINALDMEFAGRSWQDKITDMRSAMAEQEADMMVVTGLDETAWLFNLRASDIAYNPFFISYAIVENDSIRLYLLDHLTKIAKAPSDPATTLTVAEHLNTDSGSGSCEVQQGMCVEVKPYDPESVLNDVEASAQAASKVWVSYSCNFAIYSRIDPNKIHQENTPAATTKTKKNPTEVAGMKNSHIRDAVAVISFMEKLEKEVKEGKEWTEVSASDELETFRRNQSNNRGLSFNSISGSGPNGAIIHYRPSNETDRQITTDEMYLLDSGGQYLDGTTDITRTFHFGTPTDYQKECYTRVLMGHIDLFQTVWPKGLYGREIDAIARAPLWDVGLVYRHGTGHGIGMYLSVHEEPGFYEDGQFGIRLENIVMVTNATTKYHFPGTHFLTFEHITFVPYEPNIIQYDLLSDKQLSRFYCNILYIHIFGKNQYQRDCILMRRRVYSTEYLDANCLLKIQYLNDYHQLCRDRVGPELQRQGQTAGYDWMMEKSAMYERPQTTAGAGHISHLYSTLIPIMFVILRFY